MLVAALAAMQVMAFAILVAREPALEQRVACGQGTARTATPAPLYEVAILAPRTGI